MKNLMDFSKTSQSLISFMQNSNDPWGIKDKESRWVYANKKLIEVVNLKKGFDINGKLDKEIPMPMRELWEEFVNHDKKVITENKRISQIEVHYYGHGNKDTPTAKLCDKLPLLDDKKEIIGVVSHSRLLDVPALLYYMNRFNRSIIQFDAPNKLFTRRELEIAFWAQQKLSVKEIARRLGVSHQTIENRLQAMYQKAGVHTMLQFIEYCYNTGLDKYIPFNFIRNGVQLLV